MIRINFIHILITIYIDRRYYMIYVIPIINVVIGEYKIC